MPRVPDELLDAVVFLYPSEQAALSGERAGGTGFVVGTRGPLSDRLFCYLVTNDHVASGGCDVVRVNTERGVDISRVPASAWLSHPNGDDVAAAPVDIPSHWKVRPLDWAAVCPTPERMAELNVGIGDDVVMIGRFIGHEGRESNQPVARFGNIALMPGEPVLSGGGQKVQAFLVEMRSLPGFSGSPVFVYIGPASYRSNKKMMPFYSETIGLIGIDTGHKQHSSPVYVRGTTRLVDDSWEVRQNTGVAIVAPYWRIGELLEQPEFVKRRGLNEGERMD